ncbi:MAG: cryptochrome/photolyase family protein, partial [Cryomorphaceae bacterium]|nr:cryptochrome/photolyase family protein [Cryomorphaceae bacterium]
MITGRLILGDQLHPGHSWYQRVDPSVRYFLIEAREEQTYAPQHRQKMLGFLAAMRRFAAWLESKGHAVTYVPIGAGVRDLASYVAKAQKDGRVHQWEMQEPDEYRLDAALRPLMAQVVSCEHFMTERHYVAAFFAGKKTYLMESFYRDQRKKTGILMDGEQPHGGSWNYDAENR